MRKTALASIWVITILSLALPGTAGYASTQKVPGRIITTLSDGLVVSWSTPPVELIEMENGRTMIQMDGYTQRQSPGDAELPQDSLLISLPSTGEPALEVQIEESTILPVQEESLGQSPSGITINVDGSDRIFDLSQTGDNFPAPVILEEIGVMRGVRLARLTFSPIQKSGNELIVISQVTAAIDFQSGQLEDPSTLEEEIHEDGALSAVLRGIANPTQISISHESNLSTSGLNDRTGQAAIEVSSEGLTAITQSALLEAGFPVNTIDPHTLHLQRNGEEIPLEWDGNDNSVFESDEEILFYAQSRFSRYTNRDVYFLSSGDYGQDLLTTRSISTSGKTTGVLWIDAVFEENQIYTPDCYCAPIPAGRDGDRWVWERLRSPDSTTAGFNLELSDINTTQEAQITTWLIGYTEVSGTSHHVQVQVNGTTLGVLTFSGKQNNPDDQMTLNIPGGVLQSGSNTVTLSLIDSENLVDGVWLDAFSIHYAKGDAEELSGQLTTTGSSTASQYSVSVSTNGLRIYDITDPDQPVRLTGIIQDSTHAVLTDDEDILPRKYAIIPSGSILEPEVVRMVTPLASEQGADYILVSPAEFTSELTDLVNLRESQGLSVVIEDVQAIYDAVDGRSDPEAIKAFLAYAYDNWSPRPEYVLLVGDGTSDPRQYLSSSSDTWIPPYLSDVDPSIGEVPSDNQFVMVDGDDVLPDLSIGRLPVNSQVETAITITKIVNYETQPAPGNWSQNMLLVSDEFDPQAGDFAAENEALAMNYADGIYTITQVEHDSITDQTEMNETILSQWNHGSGLILYNGHSSTQQWGADVIFHINDLPDLTNGNRLPVLLEMTCLTSSFQIPDVPALDETLLRRSGKGVAAVWGSTGLSLSSGGMLLASGFLDQVTYTSGIRIGTAMDQSKVYLLTQAPALDYLLNTYMLTGDPAMPLQYDYNTYIPAVGRTTP